MRVKKGKRKLEEDVLFKNDMISLIGNKQEVDHAHPVMKMVEALEEPC